MKPTKAHEYLEKKNLKLLNWIMNESHSLSDEEAKMPIHFYGEYFYFFAKNADLRHGFEVAFIDDDRKKYVDESNFKDKYSVDLMVFISEWTTKIWTKIDGFIGFDNVKIVFDDEVKQYFKE